MTRTKRPQGSQLEAFHRHFSSSTHWKERWHETLYSSLLKPTRYTALHNRFAAGSDVIVDLGNAQHLGEVVLPGDEIRRHLRCYVHKADDGTSSVQATTFPQPNLAPNGLATHWNLDIASLLAVCILQVQPNDRILDLCAAPGGKSIAIGQSLWSTTSNDSGTKSSLHSNEFDSGRYRRLHENLQQYLPSACESSKQVQCLNVDATRGANAFPLGVGGYDKVLLDAPCSSERHIIHAQERMNRSMPPRIADELARWSPSYARRMADIQVKLLLTAIRAVRVDGRVLYATCSISKEENDDVVEKVLHQITNQNRKGQIRWMMEMAILSVDMQKSLDEWTEHTKMGYIVLPDKSTPAGAGWGPLFFTILTKAIPAEGNS